jgi:cell division protein FtsI/penicillin-binding protein 2
MSYKVIHYFTDLQDFNHPYKVGDTFPRLGLKVSNERLEELASSKNKQGKPLIEKVEEVKEKNFLDEFAETVAEDRNAKKIIYTKTEINRMSTADLKKLAKENGIDDSLSGAEIKKALIDKFGL